jgi:hypothetical protein
MKNKKEREREREREREVRDCAETQTIFLGRVYTTVFLVQIFLLPLLAAHRSLNRCHVAHIFFLRGCFLDESLVPLDDCTSIPLVM